jgi:anti-anti-sigma factor
MGWKQTTARICGDVVVIDLKQFTMLLSEEDQLVSLMRGFLERGFLKFLLNLDDLPFIDSAGLGAIVHAYTTVARRGGRLALVRVHPRIRGYLVR